MGTEFIVTVPLKQCDQHGLRREYINAGDLRVLVVDDDEIAAEDACKIEHDLSPETFDALCKYARSHGLSES